MTLTFYPHPDDTQKGTLDDRIEVLMDAAERFKAVVLEDKVFMPGENDENKRVAPRDQLAAFNWEEISRVLREVRELTESNATDKAKKSKLLSKLAEVYEVLRAAKMSKLEAVRLALMNEAAQLRGGSQVAS
jgi:hypothetical protein